jgi:predicted metallo-beta-lactamase superfamily hydrolase
MKRAKNNIMRIVEGVKAHCVIIYDHHILREEKYKERFKEVYEKAGKKLMTAAEYMGEQSMIDKITKENETMLVENKIK